MERRRRRTAPAPRRAAWRAVRLPTHVQTRVHNPGRCMMKRSTQHDRGAGRVQKRRLRTPAHARKHAVHTGALGAHSITSDAPSSRDSAAACACVAGPALLRATTHPLFCTRGPPASTPSPVHAVHAVQTQWISASTPGDSCRRLPPAVRCAVSLVRTSHRPVTPAASPPRPELITASAATTARPAGPSPPVVPSNPTPSVWDPLPPR